MSNKGEVFVIWGPDMDTDHKPTKDPDTIMGIGDTEETAEGVLAGIMFELIQKHIQDLGHGGTASLYFVRGNQKDGDDRTFMQASFVMSSPDGHDHDWQFVVKPGNLK